MEIQQLFIYVITYTVLAQLIAIRGHKIIVRPKRKLIESAENKRAEELDINNRIFLHMTDGIIAFDMDGKIVLINPAAKKLLSIAPEDST